MARLKSPKVSEADVREAFRIKGYLCEDPVEKVPWLGQKFRVSQSKSGNDNGVIAIELWWGRAGKYGWGIYISADGLQNPNTTSLLAAKGINNRYYDGGLLATCFELASVDEGALATHAQIMLAAGRACARAGSLL